MNARVPYRSARALHGYRGPPAMGALGLSLFSKIIKSMTPGPNEFKLQSTPSEVKKAIAVVGPVLSIIPVWGKIAAAGAAIVTAADQRLKAQRLAAAATAGNANTLLQEYSNVAGSAPGRAFGLEPMKAVINAFGAAGGWPASGGYKNWIQDAISGCKSCAPPTIPDFVKAQIAGGTKAAQDMLGPWNDNVNAKWNGKWLVPTAGSLQAQAIMDLFDVYVAQAGLPQTYAFAASETAANAATTSTSPAPVSVPTQSYVGPATTIQPLPASQPVTLPATTQAPAVTVNVPASVAPDATPALIQQLIAQGASSEQAFQAALQSLAARGVNTSAPAVQQQVASDVSKAVQPQQASVLYLGFALAAIVGGSLLVSTRNEKRRRRR